MKLHPNGSTASTFREVGKSIRLRPLIPPCAVKVCRTGSSSNFGKKTTFKYYGKFLFYIWRVFNYDMAAPKLVLPLSCFPSPVKKKFTIVTLTLVPFSVTFYTFNFWAYLSKPYKNCVHTARQYGRLFCI